jgi:hypothetical protein
VRKLVKLANVGQPASPGNVYSYANVAVEMRTKASMKTRIIF